MDDRRLDQLICDSATEQTVHDILELLDVDAIVQRTIPPRGKYNAIVHAQVCRCRMLGMSIASTAAYIGVAGSTLQTWLVEIPELKVDAERAEKLSQAEVIRMLFKMMHADGPTGFNAVKYFLERRTDEFKEKAEVEVRITERSQVNAAVLSIYGVGLPTLAGPAGAGGPPALPGSSDGLDLDDLEGFMTDNADFGLAEAIPAARNPFDAI